VTSPPDASDTSLHAAAPPDPFGGRSVDGLVAVVTGAASGMGRATAELLAHMGATVALLDRTPDALETAADACRELVPHGDAAVGAWVLDVTDRAAVAATVDEVVEELGHIDVLVNGAGLSVGMPIDAPTFEDAWDLTLAVDLTGYALMARACLPHLLASGAGRIVNVASTEGLGATPGLSPYTAAKHGVIGLTRSLAVELARRGVTVNCVCPGPIHTGMTAPIPDEAKQRFARRRVPLGRYGHPHEVAHAIVSLVLPAMSYVTGAVLTVDGGLTVQNT
jgi:3-oxoacyl-[acyl-carrier protein] reductase